MFITVDLLKERQACKEGILFIEKFYPQGADTLTLLQDPKLPKDFIHWAYLHIGYNNNPEIATQEKEALEKALNLVESSHVFNSQSVKHSDYVSKSYNVENSTYVYEGIDVKNSHNISHSKRVADSTDIFTSKFVTNSHTVIDSKNITNSTNVHKGTYIIDSSNIFESDLITKCNALRNCTDLSESAYCVLSKRLKHCLFCNKLEDKEYHIFNKKCSEQQFVIAMEQLSDYAPAKLHFIDEQAEDEMTWSKPHVCYNYAKHYSVIPDNDVFWEWVASLPNYNPEILYNIIFNPIFLK